MISIRPRKIDVAIEKKIITNLISDTDYAKQIIPLIEDYTFETPHARRLFHWIKNYYREYREAPQNNITDIYLVESKALDFTDAELIGNFLQEISDEYIGRENKNTKYFVDQTLPYITSRSFINLAENLKSYATLGKINECESALLNYKKVSSLQSKYVNFHDLDTARSILQIKESNGLFKMPGVVGDLIGEFERSRVVGIMGKSGIGKSFFLRETAICAMQNGFRVAEFNLEMSKEQIAMRHYKRISAMGEEGKYWLYPVADCYKNQLGLCSKPIRLGNVSLLDVNGNKPKWEDHDKNYVPCDACRGNEYASDYQWDTWFTMSYRDELNEKTLIQKIKAFNIMYGDNLRTRAFPKFSATVSDIEHELDMMEDNEGFVPDIITIDYDDLIKAERSYNEERNTHDEVYKSIGRLAQIRNISVVIGIQLNRVGAEAKKAKSTHISQDFRKMMHLDGLVILNQTDREKQAGVLRVGIGKLRDGEFTTSKEVAVLQQLGLAMSNLDSEYIKTAKKDDD